MQKNMEFISEKELLSLNGGGFNINVDINEVIEQINPMKWAYDFGHDVVYPYIWKPLKNLFS